MHIHLVFFIMENMAEQWRPEGCLSVAVRPAGSGFDSHPTASTRQKNQTSALLFDSGRCFDV